VDPATLYQLLTQHQPGEVYRLLKSLLDFLRMPGNTAQWLPPLRNISVRHAGVERLHYHPRASAMAEAILGFCPFNSSGSSISSSSSTTDLDEFASSHTRAVFCVAVHAAPAGNCCSYCRKPGRLSLSDSGPSLSVYVINRQFEFVRDDYGRVIDADLVMAANAAYDRPYRRLRLGYSQSSYKQGIYTQLLPTAQLEPGPPALSGPCNEAMFVSPDGVLGRCITGELKAALQEAPGDGGPVKVKCCRYINGSKYVHVWVVCW
jgi:hypothetical protein